MANHPKEEIAKFGYRSERTIDIFSDISPLMTGDNSSTVSSACERGGVRGCGGNGIGYQSASADASFWLKTHCKHRKFGGARPPRLASPRLACHLPCLWALWSGEDDVATTTVFGSGIGQRCASACRFFCIEHASSFGTAGDAVVVVDLETNKAKKEKKKRPCVLKKLAPNGSELVNGRT